jgi:glutaredoxin
VTLRGGGGAVLYTRQACPLCFALERLAERSSRRHGVSLIEADVDADPALQERYGSRVPVLELPGGGSLSGRAGARDVDEAFAKAADFLRRLQEPLREGRVGDMRSRRRWSGWIRRLLRLNGSRPGDWTA